MTIATQPARRPNIVLAEDDHEQIVIRQDPETGLRFIVAVHSTALGPSLGGMRLKRYSGGLRDALEDVMGLARTMTLKASAAGLDLGGGKSVMIDDGRPEMREAWLAGAAQVIATPVEDPFGTAGVRQRVLDAWAASPARFREDANAEEDFALGGYRDRLVVELAQNAADAASRDGVAGRLHLRRDPDRLVVANTGALTGEKL